MLTGFLNRVTCNDWRRPLSNATGSNYQSEESLLFIKSLSADGVMPSSIHNLIRNLCNCESSTQRLQMAKSFMLKHQNMIMIVIYSLVANIITINTSVNNGEPTNNEQKINNMLQVLGGMGGVLIISIILKVIENRRNLTCDLIIRDCVKELIAYFAVAVSTVPAHYPPKSNNSNWGKSVDGLTKRESLIFTNTVLQLIASRYNQQDMPTLKYIGSNFVSGGAISLLGIPIDYLLVYLNTYCAENKYSTADTVAIIASSIFLCDIFFACLNTMRLFMLDNIFHNPTNTPPPTIV